MEPVLNQHRLVIDRSVIEWDYASNKDEAPELRLMYMLFYQMSRMCREKGAVKHDDRLDALAQGVKYFTDALSISAYEQVRLKKSEDFLDLLENWQDNPHQAANHLALGMDLDLRKKARGLSGKSSVPTWV